MITILAKSQQINFLCGVCRILMSTKIVCKIDLQKFLGCEMPGKGLNKTFDKIVRILATHNTAQGHFTCFRTYNRGPIPGYGMDSGPRLAFSS